MNLRVLLVNPWIYDFAAYNLWARPLGLLTVAEYLSAFDAELSLIDCTASCTPKRYGTGKFRAEIARKPDVLRNVPRRYRRYGISNGEFTVKVKAFMPFDFVLITSVMSYWYPGVQEAVEVIRSIAGDVPVILGGSYATLYTEHASENSGADFIYRGPLNEGFLFALNTFGFRLKKEKERVPYYRLNVFGEHPFAPVLTSRGCPFDCSYCASRLLSGAYRRRPAQEVVREIQELSCMGIRDFAFYDDALLAEPGGHVKPLLSELAGRGLDIRLHAPNGLHARYLDEETAYLMKRAGFTTIRLGLETFDVQRQQDTGGKVSTEDVRRAVRHLRENGFNKEEVGVYLLYGLPGQKLEDVKEGADFLMSLGVRIHLAEFSPIRGTRSWGELLRMGVIADGLDPLLTNNSVFSFLFSGDDPEEVARLKLRVKEYNSA